MVQTVLLLSCTVHRPSDSLPGLPCKRQACQLPLEMLLSGICGRGRSWGGLPCYSCLQKRDSLQCPEPAGLIGSRTDRVKIPSRTSIWTVPL